MIEVPEASVRAAMLLAGEADLAPVSVADVSRLRDGGILFNDVLQKFQGLWVHMSGNHWVTEDMDGAAIERTNEDLPWIGNPWASGTFNDGAYDGNTPSMVNARKVREAMAIALDRDLLGETILGGYGGPNYRIMNHHAPEWIDGNGDEDWIVPYDGDRARALLAEAGYADGFEFELWCPLDVGNDIEVCLAVAGMWKDELNLDAKVSTTVYTANRPKLVDRTFTSPWILPWGDNRKGAEGRSKGGAYPGCCRWPTIGFNIGYEDPTGVLGYMETKGQEKGSAENMASRKVYMDAFASEWLEFGIVDFPNLLGLGDKILSWPLKPQGMLNSWDEIVIKK
jgi:ABC-type transport system substrate-binding protein